MAILICEIHSTDSLSKYLPRLLHQLLEMDERTTTYGDIDME